MKEIKNKLYYRELECWVELDENQYLELRRERQRIYYRRYTAGECYCPKKELWLCDGVCESCKYYCKKTLSLEKRIQCKMGEVSLKDTIADTTDYEEYFTEVIDDSSIIERIRELAPELIVYGQKKLEGKTESEIVKEMGCARSTIFRKMKKVQAILEAEYKNF